MSAAGTLWAMSRRAQAAATVAAALLLTGCSIPLVGRDPELARVTIGAETPSASETATPAPEVFDPTCEPLPRELADWIDTNSWWLSKTHPNGKGWMVSSGIGRKGFRYWVAVVPVRESVGYKAWAWGARPDGSVYEVVGVRTEWTSRQRETRLAEWSGAPNPPWWAEAHRAALECLKG